MSGAGEQSRVPRAVIVTARFPWPSYTGDRIRASHWIRALGSEMNVTLVAPAGAGIPAGIQHVELKRSAGSWLANALALVRQGLPLHYVIGAGLDWHAAGRELARRARFDVAVMMLTRPTAWIDVRRLADVTILDAVDALSASMRERAAATAFPARLLWRTEARRTERHEQVLTGRFDAVAITAPDDPTALPGSVVVPLGMDAGDPPVAGARRFDFGFWGRLPYFANADALETLLREVWPRIRAARPGATLMIGGAEAPRSILDRHGRDGIHVFSPMPDRSALLRDVTIALMPVHYGTGQSTKVLEAAEAACAIVATPRALRGQPSFPGAAALVESEPAALAKAACDLLVDEERRATMTAVARAWLTEHCSMENVLESMRRVVSEAARRRGTIGS